MIRVINTNRYTLKGTRNRWWHLATLTKGVREFILLLDDNTKQTYIEEITGGDLKKIEDDDLWNDLFNIIREKNLDAWIKQ